MAEYSKDETQVIIPRCPTCGRRPPPPRDTGEISQEELDRLLAEYGFWLVKGAIGWGISFIDWLHIAKGWEHCGRRKFKRVEGWEDPQA